ncbi:unnamed protein product, partial [Mesorhabditis spiculigera]
MDRRFFRIKLNPSLNTPTKTIYFNLLDLYPAALHWRLAAAVMTHPRSWATIDVSNFLPSAERTRFYEEYVQERFDFGAAAAPEDWKIQNSTNTQDACKSVQPQKTLQKMFSKILTCHPFGRSDIEYTEDLLGQFDEIERHSNWVRQQPEGSGEVEEETVSETFEAFEKRYLNGPVIFSPNAAQFVPYQDKSDDLLKSVFGSEQRSAVKPEADNHQNNNYEELKDAFLLWATGRGFNASTSEARRKDVRGFIRSLYGMDREAATQKLAEKVASIETETLPSQFCILDQLKSSAYLSPDKFMPPFRVVIGDLQLAYNNANICRYLAEGGYDVAEKGAFDFIDKITVVKFAEIYENLRLRISAGTWFGTVRRIREDTHHLKIDESSLLPSDERSKFYKDFAAERHRFLIGLVRELELYRFNFTNALSCWKLAQPQKTLAKMFDKILNCQPFGKTFGAAQERLAQAENRQKDGYEELKDKYVRWATTRGLNNSDSEERQNGARVFVKSFYGMERSDVLKKLSEKVAVIEKESPPSEFCIMDQLKSAYYLQPEKFMLLTRVLLQDLQTVYNNANICRRFSEAGYDVAEEGAFDNIDKMAIDTFTGIYKNMRARLDYLDALRENGRH